MAISARIFSSQRSSVLEVLRMDWETLRELLTPTNTVEVARAFHSFLELFSIWSFMGVVACDVLLRFIGERKGWTWPVHWQERLFRLDCWKCRFTLFRWPAHSELVSAKSLLKTNSLIWFAIAIMLEFATHRYSERVDALTDDELSASQKQIGAALVTSGRAIERATTLEAIIQPRYLTDDEVRQIKEGLKTIPGRDLMIGSHWLDAESARLAGQVKMAFNAAGIGNNAGNPEDLIGKWPRVPLGLFGGSEFHGTDIHVGIEVWGKDRKLVADTLRSATHFDVATPDTPSPFGFDAGNLVSVFVGLKPLPEVQALRTITQRETDARLALEKRVLWAGPRDVLIHASEDVFKQRLERFSRQKFKISMCEPGLASEPRVVSGIDEPSLALQATVIALEKAGWQLTDWPAPGMTLSRFVPFTIRACLGPGLLVGIRGGASESTRNAACALQGTINDVLTQAVPSGISTCWSNTFALSQHPEMLPEDEIDVEVGPHPVIPGDPWKTAPP
jgi:hypothetical protein